MGNENKTPHIVSLTRTTFDIMDPVDKFEENILLNLVRISPDTAERIVKKIPSDFSNKIVKILRDNKINQVIKK